MSLWSTLVIIDKPCSVFDSASFSGCSRLCSTRMHTDNWLFMFKRSNSWVTVNVSIVQKCTSVIMIIDIGIKSSIQLKCCAVVATVAIMIHLWVTTKLAPAAHFDTVKVVPGSEVCMTQHVWGPSTRNSPCNLLLYSAIQPKCSPIPEKRVSMSS